MEKLGHTESDRIGFRYFPDTIHYRESDLQIWLPELQSLGAHWLVLETPSDRAIPETFLRGLIKAGIQPVLQMRLPLNGEVPDLTTLFQVYASWGVEYLSPFDQPNTLEAWGNGGWVQQKLVSRFLDAFIPLAEKIHQAGMQPVFPALEPGGNFWDTVFLRSALQGIRDRGHTRLLNDLVLGAYAWPGSLPLDWGAGGPAAWPDVHPYDTPEGQQDHLGFRIFDWYGQIAEKVTGRIPRILVMGTGVHVDKHIDEVEQARLNAEIAAQLDDEEAIPANVIAACFASISIGEDDPLIGQAWYSPDGDQKEVVAAFKSLFAPKAPAVLQEEAPEERLAEEPAENAAEPVNLQKPITHYLLLPHPRWGNPDWFLKVTRSFIKKYAPTCGYSIKEAFFAKRVTIVGGIQVFPENLKAELEKNGAEVIQITGDGTEIATQMAEL
ncbi:MAG: hypothetical protein ACK2T7_09520 [Anaerolineales bacterium]